MFANIFGFFVSSLFIITICLYYYAYVRSNYNKLIFAFLIILLSFFIETLFIICLSIFNLSNIRDTYFILNYLIIIFSLLLFIQRSFKGNKWKGEKNGIN